MRSEGRSNCIPFEGSLSGEVKSIAESAIVCTCRRFGDWRSCASGVLVSTCIPRRDERSRESALLRLLLVGTTCSRSSGPFSGRSSATFDWLPGKSSTREVLSGKILRFSRGADGGAVDSVGVREIVWRTSPFTAVNPAGCDSSCGEGSPDALFSFIG